MIQIRGLRFTKFKGGEGSGWFGPPRGTHGSGSQEGEALSLGRVSPEAINKHFSTKIPTRFLSVVEHIEVVNNLDKRGTSSGRTITLRSDADAAVFAHEVGHINLNSKSGQELSKTRRQIQSTAFFKKAARLHGEKYHYDANKIADEVFSTLFAKHFTERSLPDRLAKIIGI